MPFVPVPNTVGVEVRMIQDSQRIENTLYFRKAAGWLAVDVPVLFNELLLWWTVDLAPHLNVSVQLNEFQITDLSTQTGFGFTIPAPAPKPTGGRAGAGLPNNCSLAITFRTALRGRSFRGRNFVPGLVDVDVSANTLSGVTVGQIEAAYTNLIARAVTVGAIWVVVSRFHNNSPRVTGITTDITAAGATDAIIDSQRRRLPKRGQ